MTVALRAPPVQSLSLPMFWALKTNSKNISHKLRKPKEKGAPCANESHMCEVCLDWMVVEKKKNMAKMAHSLLERLLFRLAIGVGSKLLATSIIA